MERNVVPDFAALWYLFKQKFQQEKIDWQCTASGPSAGGNRRGTASLSCTGGSYTSGSDTPGDYWTAGAEFLAPSALIGPILGPDLFTGWILADFGMQPMCCVADQIRKYSLCFSPSYVYRTLCYKITVIPPAFRFDLFFIFFFIMTTTFTLHTRHFDTERQ